MLLASLSLLRLCWYLPKKNHRTYVKESRTDLTDPAFVFQHAPDSRVYVQQLCDKSIEISCTKYLGISGVYLCPMVLVKGGIEVDEFANTDPFKGD